MPLGLSTRVTFPFSLTHAQGFPHLTVSVLTLHPTLYYQPSQKPTRQNQSIDSLSLFCPLALGAYIVLANYILNCCLCSYSHTTLKARSQTYLVSTLIL